MGSQGVGSRGIHAAVDVDATAKVITSGRTVRKSLIVQNNEPATNVLYVGFDSSVTTANGLAIGPGESYRFDEFSGDLWGIADTADTDVRVLEVY